MSDIDTNAEVKCSNCKEWIPSGDSNMTPSQAIICDQCMNDLGMTLCDSCFKVVPQVSRVYYVHDQADPCCLECGEKKLTEILNRTRTRHNVFLRDNKDVAKLLTPKT